MKRNMASVLIENAEWSAQDLPSGLSIDSTTGAITGTPAQGTGAFGSGGQTSYTVPVRVNTPYGTTTKSINVIVRKTRYEIRKNNTKFATVTLGDLKKMAEDGTVETRFGFGAELIVPVHNLYNQESAIYECPFRLGTVREFELQDGTKFTGLGLVSKYGLPVADVQFDAKEPSNSNSDRKQYGNNRWMYSALRQWMNKAGTNWWESQHSADASPTAEWVASHGLLDCFPASFIDAIQPVKTVTQTHSVDGGGLDTTYDKFFCLSANEVFSGQVVDEGSQWEFYESGSKVHYSISNTSSKVCLWLRSVRPGDSSGVWGVYSGGSLDDGGAGNAYRACAACSL